MTGSSGDDELGRLALAVQLGSFAGPSIEPDLEALLDAGLGGLCLFANNTGHGSELLRSLTDAVHRARPMALVVIDEEGGDVTRMHAGSGSPWPGPAVLGDVDDPERTWAVAQAIGRDLRDHGIDATLAPVADVNSNPDNPIIGVRSFGDEPELVARHVTAWVRGVQSTGIAACAKHFPGHGDTSEDSHTDRPQVTASIAVLRRRELRPFAASVQAGVAMVMMSHVVMQTVAPGRPATLSPEVHRLLRDDLGFEGVVLTDALDMAAASAGRGIPAAAVLALEAGADLLLLGADKGPAPALAVRDAIVSAVRSGRLSERRLREAASRVETLGRRAAGARDEHARRADPQGTALAAHDRECALEAVVRDAERALRIEGALPDLRNALLVRMETDPTIAAGPVPWGLPADLVLDAADPASLSTLLTAAGDGVVIIQVRDAHRQASLQAFLTAAAERLVGLVLIEWGWPAAAPGTVPRICTLGASTASRRAVERLLARLIEVS